MRNRLLATLGLGFALALAGCTPPTSEWTDAQVPKKLHIDFVRLQHSAAFTPGSAELAEGAAEDLAAFLDHADMTADDHVYFEPASNDGLTAGRIGQLARTIGQRGIGAATLPPSAKDVPADHMMVIVERYVVTPPNCPNWSKPAYGGDHGNTMPSNYGCADATNLGLMVADPRDLVIGRTLGPAEGDPAIAGMARYRECKVKPLNPTSTSGTFSATRAADSASCDK